MLNIGGGKVTFWNLKDCQQGSARPMRQLVLNLIKCILCIKKLAKNSSNFKWTNPRIISFWYKAASKSVKWVGFCKIFETTACLIKENRRIVNFVFPCLGEIHGLPRPPAGGEADAVHQRLPWRSHWNRIYSHWHKPSAGFRSLSLQQPRLWLPKRERKGKNKLSSTYILHILK